MSTVCVFFFPSSSFSCFRLELTLSFPFTPPFSSSLRDRRRTGTSTSRSTAEFGSPFPPFPILDSPVSHLSCCCKSSFSPSPPVENPGSRWTTAGVDYGPREYAKLHREESAPTVFRLIASSPDSRSSSHSSSPAAGNGCHPSHPQPSLPEAGSYSYSYSHSYCDSYFSTANPSSPSSSADSCSDSASASESRSSGSCSWRGYDPDGQHRAAGSGNESGRGNGGSGRGTRSGRGSDRGGGW